MIWNFTLAIVSIVMSLLFGAAGFIQHWMEASAIAPALAPQIGIDEDILRSHLVSILETTRIRRAIFYARPWAVFALLFSGRVIADILAARRKNEETRKRCHEAG